MVIVFDGDTLDLMKRLQQFAKTDEKTTLDFMLENFKILKDLSSYKNEITLSGIYKSNEQT